MIDIRNHGGMFSGRNGGRLNIYSQLTEPVKKQGIWLQNESQL